MAGRPLVPGVRANDQQCQRMPVLSPSSFQLISIMGNTGTKEEEDTDKVEPPPGLVVNKREGRQAATDW